MAKQTNKFLDAVQRTGITDTHSSSIEVGTRGWSTGKKHRDKGDAFSLGGRRRKAPITLAPVKGSSNDSA